MRGDTMAGGVLVCKDTGAGSPGTEYVLTLLSLSTSASLSCRLCSPASQAATYSSTVVVTSSLNS